MASIELAPRTAPPTFPAGAPFTTTGGNWSGLAPRSARAASSQTLPSKSGKAEKAVAVSSDGSPDRAKLATAWAGQ